MASGEAVGTGRLLRQLLGRLLSRPTVSLDLVAQADSLRLLGDLEQAETLCSLVLREYPTYASAHVVKGEILRDKGSLEAAEAAWEQARRLHPGHPRANLRLAQLYLSRGEVARAMAALEPALLTNGYAPEATVLAQQTQSVGGAATAARWLTRERFGALVEAVQACASVQTARLVGPEGKAVFGEAEQGGQAEADEQAAALLLESRALLERVGAGPLQAVFLCGRNRHTELYEVNGQCLVAELTPDAQPSRVRSEIQAAVAALRRQWENSEPRHAESIPA